MGGLYNPALQGSLGEPACPGLDTSELLGVFHAVVLEQPEEYKACLGFSEETEAQGS